VQQLLANGVSEGGGQDRADVADGRRLHPVLAALADRAAAGPAILAPMARLRRAARTRYCLRPRTHANRNRPLHHQKTA
jgi:hypothetical protein